MPQSFYEARRIYRQLSKRYFGGNLSLADYHAEVRTIRVEDDDGHKWRIDSETGEWQRYDEGRWVHDNPDLSLRFAEMMSGENVGDYEGPEISWEIIGGMALVVIVMIIAAVILYNTLQVP